MSENTKCQGAQDILLTPGPERTLMQVPLLASHRQEVLLLEAIASRSGSDGQATARKLYPHQKETHGTRKVPPEAQ